MKNYQKEGENEEKTRFWANPGLIGLYFFRVGKLILTKARGSNVVGDAEDITGDYKHKDGSNAERLAVYNAIRGVDRYVKFKRKLLF